MFDEKDFRPSQFNKLAGGLAKTKSVKQTANEEETASETFPTYEDIADLPEFINAQLADDRTKEVFRVTYNVAVGNGKKPAEALDMAWGAITQTGTRTSDGKYTISGQLSPFVESTYAAAYAANRYGDSAKSAKAFSLLKASQFKPLDVNEIGNKFAPATGYSRGTK